MGPEGCSATKNWVELNSAAGRRTSLGFQLGFCFSTSRCTEDSRAWQTSAVGPRTNIGADREGLRGKSWPRNEAGRWRCLEGKRLKRRFHEEHDALLRT